MYDGNQEFGNLCRQWRLYRHLSQQGLAITSGVSVRSLRYWENGQRHPSGEELERVLNALQVTIEERREAYRLNPRPDILRRDRELENSLLVSTHDMSRLPHLGDLLRMLRQRCGKTQEQLASEIRVTLTTVTRWETLRKYPSEENLDRICQVLHANTEEAYALRSRHLLLREWPSKPDLDMLDADFQSKLYQQSMQNPLADLHFLALRRQVGQFIPTHSEAKPLLARILLEHGNLLLWQQRYAQSRAAALEAHRLFVETGQCARYGHALGNLTSCFTGHWKRDYVLKAKFLEGFLSSTEIANVQIGVLCDMAFYYGRDGRFEEAQRLLRRANEVYANAQQTEELEKSYQYYKMSGARLNLAQEQGDIALQDLQSVMELQPTNLQLILYTAEAALAIGEKAEAARLLKRIEELTVGVHLPLMREQVSELVQRL